MTELALVREAGYRFLATVFLYPDRARRARVRRIARALLDAPEFRALAFTRAWEPLLERCAGGLGEELEAVYVRLFGLTGKGPACSLCESAYREGPAAECCGRLSQAYREAGLVPSGPEPPDHLSVQLEYLSALVHREAEAWHQAPQEAARLLHAERAFLLDHPWRWVPELGRCLQSHDAGGLHASAAEALEAFLEHEVDLAPLLVARASVAVRG